MPLLKLAHVNTHESVILLQFCDALIMIRRHSILSVQVQGELFCQFGLANPGASEEEHRKRSFRVDPAAFAKSNGLRQRTDGTALADEFLSDLFLQLEQSLCEKS